MMLRLLKMVHVLLLVLTLLPLVLLFSPKP